MSCRSNNVIINHDDDCRLLHHLEIKDHPLPVGVRAGFELSLPLPRLIYDAGLACQHDVSQSTIVVGDSMVVDENGRVAKSWQF